MRLTLADVLDRLVVEGLARPEALERVRVALAGATDASPPWFARVVAGVGAWVATGFLIGFLVVTKIVRDEISSIAVGAVFLAAATYLRRTADPDEDFKRQLCLAGSLAGLVLAIVGVLGQTKSATAAGVVALVVAIVLIPLVPDAAHRFMSALIGTVAAVAVMADLRLVWPLGRLPGVGSVVVRGSDLAVLALVAVSAYVWRAGLRRRPRERAEMLGPVGYGIVAALFGVLLFSSLFVVADDLVRGSRSARGNAWHLGPATTVGITAALVALVRAIFAEQRVPARRETLTAAIVGCLLLGALTLSTPGVVAAVTALALGFDRRDRILVGLAVVFLAKFASAYYYTLSLTLLEKSVVLVASGLLLLAARAYVELRFTAREADA